MSDDRYCEEKFRLAVDALATSGAPLRERLVSAALSIHVLRPEDFSDRKLGTDYSALEDMLTWREAEADEGTIGATIARLSDEQAEAVAAAIFSIYVGLTLRR